MATKNLKTTTVPAFLVKEVARRDWLIYTNLTSTVQIERSLANHILRATKGMKPEPNEMDVLAALAGFHWQYQDRLAEIREDYKQVEVFLPALRKRAIHLFVDDKGKKYVCDTPLLPYH
jgi:hypothetical protein